MGLPSEKGIRIVELAALYELRLTISEGTKTEYTREELLELLDQIAAAKK